MISTDTEIDAPDPYIQTLFDPRDRPTAPPKAERVERRPDADTRRKTEALSSEIAALRAHIDSEIAGTKRRFDRTHLVLAAVVGILVGAVAMLLFGAG